MSGGTKVRAQNRGALSRQLSWVNEAARRDKQTRFTSLLHHLDEAALERSFHRLKRDASAGVDGETVASYEHNLQDRLQDLAERVHTGRYRAQPVRRVYIPKADGGRRPLGIPALEDKLVQGAVAEVLSNVYEADFLGFSYGFRPGRSPHHALAALNQAVMTQRVNWVLDADVRSFFDSVDHEWLQRMLAHRIADRRVLRLIRKWLRAGVLEEKGYGPRPDKGPRKERRLARSWPMCFCTMCWICGYIGGDGGTHGDELSSCGTVTTSSWVSSTRRTHRRCWPPSVSVWQDLA